ncbi:hypothetical protein JTE90_023141 [Oedothorax gibbosus]|uniref:Uncharacterized protein n=1 Tax=Oedothorax gibbosus TaxID=931172 RepID=A0AAV6US21_9ARAC|nr:hypothetical protein JTE90_023141 [Oedothorax gibbosus]
MGYQCSVNDSPRFINLSEDHTLNKGGLRCMGRGPSEAHQLPVKGGLIAGKWRAGEGLCGRGPRRGATGKDIGLAIRPTGEVSLVIRPDRLGAKPKV